MQIIRIFSPSRSFPLPPLFYFRVWHASRSRPISADLLEGSRVKTFGISKGIRMCSYREEKLCCVCVYVCVCTCVRVFLFFIFPSAFRSDPHTFHIHLNIHVHLHISIIISIRSSIDNITLSSSLSTCRFIYLSTRQSLVPWLYLLYSLQSITLFLYMNH